MEITSLDFRLIGCLKIESDFYFEAFLSEYKSGFLGAAFYVHF
ncbi:hypothetical protein [Clostridium estertheticum]|nr:hypothetical protein [Clostridium estertheticum]